MFTWAIAQKWQEFDNIRMQMFYKIAADIVVLLHFLWIVFLIFGAVIGKRYKWVKNFHIGGMTFTLIIQIFGWYCPLTHLEFWLRQMHDPSLTYSGSFIIHYVEKVVYINLSMRTIFIMTVALLLINAWIYLRKPKNRP